VSVAAVEVRIRHGGKALRRMRSASRNGNVGKLVRLVFASILSFGVVATVEVQGQNVKRSGLAVMSAGEAHAKALAGALVLVDIRTTDEWRETGVPASGYTITMHQDRVMFMRQLVEAAGGSLQKPIALICAVGSRSAFLQRRLKQAGFENVIDVGEGVIGGRRGTGWIKSGLPIRRWLPGLDAPESHSN
jgi:rhodanese-related sulfurtransferase